MEIAKQILPLADADAGHPLPTPVVPMNPRRSASVVPPSGSIESVFCGHNVSQVRETIVGSRSIDVVDLLGIRTVSKLPNNAVHGEGSGKNRCIVISGRNQMPNRFSCVLGVPQGGGLPAASGSRLLKHPRRSIAPSKLPGERFIVKQSLEEAMRW